MKPTIELPISLLHECLVYDPVAGDFFWKARPRDAFVNARAHSVYMKIYPGRKAGFTNSKGYVEIRVAYRLVKAHRIAWAMTHGRYPACQIDHINGNRADNRLVNLREATNAQNQWNRPGRLLSPPGVKGVQLRSKGWHATITANGVRYFLGVFPTLEEAQQRWIEAAKELHGEFAYAGRPDSASTARTQEGAAS